MYCIISLFFYSFTNLYFIKHKYPIAYRHSIFNTVRESSYILCIGLVWFGLFVHPLSHTSNIGHVNYRLQSIYYNTTYNIWTAIQYNEINNSKKFNGQLEVEFVTTSRYIHIYIYIYKYI